MQFMNSCLYKLVKNLSDEGFKHLVEEFGSENLELLKQQGANPYEHMKSFERFNEKNYLEKIENIFTALQRMKILIMMLKYQVLRNTDVKLQATSIP